MLFIYRLRPETLPKIVNQILHGGDMAEEGDFLRLVCIIHTKNSLVVFLRIVAFRRCHGNFVQNRRLPLNPVQPECPHRLPLIAESADIVVIAVPGQLIGTDSVRLSVIRNIALLVHIKIRVIKPDLAVQIDGIIDRVDAVVAGMIAALIAVRDGNMPPEPLGIFHSRQRQQLRNQVTGNIRRYEPGRRECINQDLQLAHFKWPAVVKVFVLCQLNILNVQIRFPENRKIIADRIPGNLQIIIILEHLCQLGRRLRMIRIRMLKKVLI